MLTAWAISAPHWFLFCKCTYSSSALHGVEEIIIIAHVSSGVIEQKQQTNPGAQWAPPGICEGFAANPEPGPVVAASQHEQGIGEQLKNGCSKTTPNKLICRYQTKPLQWDSQGEETNRNMLCCCCCLQLLPFCFLLLDATDTAAAVHVDRTTSQSNKVQISSGIGLVYTVICSTWYCCRLNPVQSWRNM